MVDIYFLLFSKLSILYLEKVKCVLKSVHGHPLLPMAVASKTSCEHKTLQIFKFLI